MGDPIISKPIFFWWNKKDFRRRQKKREREARVCVQDLSGSLREKKRELCEFRRGWSLWDPT